ncbi:MAG: glycosyltransferase [Calothrix sp. C42_A2020_038]|nr:glycosyltransferase [Calothrix sp. C42_A2020_038]
MPKSQTHVAIFLRCLFGGGTERVMVNLANSFTDCGLKVDLVLAHKSGPYLSQVAPKVRIIDFKSPKLAASVPKLARYLQQEQPLSLLSALHYPSEIAIFAKHTARVKTRVVIAEQNTLSLEAKNLPQRTARLTPLKARLFYPWANAIVAVSQGVADDLAQVIKVPRQQIQVIYNPVIPPDILEKSQKDVAHPWFNSGEPPVILGVGRLIEQKDFPTLIRAFAQVLSIRPARLMILGVGSQKPYLETLIRELNLENYVTILGFQENPYAYMARASVFALSSAWEGFGNVIVEALAVGTPVVSTNCLSGPAEILAGGKYGSLVPVGDSQAMAKSILKVLSGNYPIVDSNWLNQFTYSKAASKYIDVLHLKQYIKAPYPDFSVISC